MTEVEQAVPLAVVEAASSPAEVLSNEKQQAVAPSDGHDGVKPAQDLPAEIRTEEEGDEEEEEEEESEEGDKPAVAVPTEAEKHDDIEDLIFFFDEKHPPENLDKDLPVAEVADNCVTAVDDASSPNRERCESPALEVTKDDSRVHFSGMEESADEGDKKKKKTPKKKKKKMTKKVEEASTHSSGRQDSPSKAHRVIEVQDVARAKTSIARNRPPSRSSSPPRHRDPEINIATYYPYHTVLLQDMYVRPVVVTILIPERLPDMSPAKKPQKAKKGSKGTKGGAESSEDEAFADDDSVDGTEQNKEENDKNVHDIKHLKQFIVKVNDVVANKDATYVVVLRDFRNLLKDLMDEYEERRVADYFKPNSLKWWAKYIKKLVLVYDRPTGQMSLLVDKKMIRRLIKKKMEHHQWMLASISVAASSVIQAQASTSSPSRVLVEEEVTIDYSRIDQGYDASHEEAAAVDAFSATYKSEYYIEDTANVEQSMEEEVAYQETQQPSDEAKESNEALVVEDAEHIEAQPTEQYQEGYEAQATDQQYADQSQYPQDQTGSYYGEGQEGYQPEQSYDENTYQDQQATPLVDYPVDENGQQYSADGTQPQYQYDSSFENSYYNGSADQSAIAPANSFDSNYDHEHEVEYLFKEEEESMAHHSITLPSVAPENVPKKKKGHKSKSVDYSGHGSSSSLPSINRGKSGQGEREITPSMAKMNELLSKAYAPIYSMYTEEDIENVTKSLMKKKKKYRARSMIELPIIEQEPSLQLSDAPEGVPDEHGELQKASSVPVILAPIIPNRSPSFASVKSSDSRSIHSRPLSPFERDVHKLRGSEKLAADIIGKVRRRVFTDPRQVKKKISQSEAKLIASPFAKKLLIEKPNVEELLSDLSVKDGASK